MSCYESEHGALTIPSAQWAAFKASIREAYNKSQLDAFQRAAALQVKILILHGVHKNKNPKTFGGYWENLLEMAVEAVERPVYERWGTRTYSALYYDQQWDIESALFRNGTDKPPLKPLKKDFPLANSATKSLAQGEAYVGFDDERRRVIWNVSENNHAIESARSTALGRALFAALAKIKWTRGSGGFIIGNNEYNRDSEDEGGGGNTVNDEYGPEVDKRRKEAEERSRRGLRSSYNQYSTVYRFK